MKFFKRFAKLWLIMFLCVSFCILLGEFFFGAMFGRGDSLSFNLGFPIIFFSYPDFCSFSPAVFSPPGYDCHKNSFSFSSLLFDITYVWGTSFFLASLFFIIRASYQYLSKLTMAKIKEELIKK